MNEDSAGRELKQRLTDLSEQCRRWQKQTESVFLTEEQQVQARQWFAPSALIRYDGGYEGARRKKVIFLPWEEDDFSDDIVCIETELRGASRPLTHRDVLGSLMALQIERSALGDLWVEDNARAYVYTTAVMARYLCDQCTRIGPCTADFRILPERPVQHFRTRQFTKVVASLRLDAVTAALASVSREKAKEMIRQGLVQVDHITLEEPDKVCHNGCTISIRGTGRFTYRQTTHTTRKDRIVAEFLQDL